VHAESNYLFHLFVFTFWLKLVAEGILTFLAPLELLVPYLFVYTFVNNSDSRHVHLVQYLFHSCLFFSFWLKNW